MNYPLPRDKNVLLVWMFDQVYLFADLFGADAFELLVLKLLAVRFPCEHCLALHFADLFAADALVFHVLEPLSVRFELIVLRVHARVCDETVYHVLLNCV